MWWKKKKSHSCNSTVTVNGKTIRVQGNNIVISDDHIYVDGKLIDESMDAKNITVIVEGDCNNLDAYGNVDASGSVRCGNVAGDIDASGSVHCKRG